MVKIFVNGTFDVLHPGHIALLNHAKSLGTHLMVAIDSDRRVRELKGPKRPVHNEDVRKLMLENLKAVDAVWVFDSDEELRNAIKTYGPAIMVKGSDYHGQPIIGQDLVPHIEFFERVNEYSSTNTIQSIVDRG